MSLSVRDILNLDKEYRFSVIAGARGLDTRQVSTCVVVDVPDAQSWIRGGEFLISAGYIFTRNPLALLSLIEGAALAGAAALGIKVGRFLGDLPREVIELADRLDFPLIDIPAHINHGDIINKVLAAIVNQRFRILSQSSGIQDFFLDQVVRGAPFEAILDGFERFTGCPVRLVQEETQSVASSRGLREGSFADIAQGTGPGEGGPLVDIAASGPPLLSARVDALTLAGRHLGDLYYAEGREPEDELAKAALSSVKTALMILLQQGLAITEAKRRRGDDLLQDLLFRRGISPQDQAAVASMLGWRHEGRALIAVMKAASGQGAELAGVAAICARVLSARVVGALFTEVAGAAVFVLPVPEGCEADRGLRDEVRQALREVERQTGIGMVAALGSPRPGLALVGESYHEARETLELLERLARFGETARWDDMDLERILIIAHGTDAGRRLVQRRLSPLVNADRRHPGKATGLLRTLKVFAEHHWSVKETSVALSVHYNTMKYRIQHITSLLDLDFDDYQSRFEVALALRLYQIDNKII